MNCEKCIHAKPFGGPNDNRCSAWSCEFIDRNEAIELWKAFKNGELIRKKEGHWIKHENGYWTFLNDKGDCDGWIPDYECSICGSRGWKNRDGMNYCPNCGANMKGE